MDQAASTPLMTIADTTITTAGSVPTTPKKSAMPI